MIYINLILIFFAAFLISGCQTMPGHSTNFSQEINSFRSYCSNFDTCQQEIKKRVDFIDRFKTENLSSYERHQLGRVINDLDELKFQKLAFPKYCLNSAECITQIKVAESILKNINPPITNQYPGMREINIKSMQSGLEDLVKSKKRYQDEEVQQKKPGVKIGMTAKNVIENTSWGKPNKINRTTNKYGVREQWVYGGGNYLYFDNGILTSIQN